MHDLPRRKSIRLPGYDYAKENWYFITICAQNRRCIFGKIIGENQYWSPYGHIAKSEWLKLRSRYPNITLDEFVIMPNHIHGVISVGATLAVARDSQSQNRAGVNPAPTLGQIIGSYKSIVVRHSIDIATSNKREIGKMWQRNYYERIIRDRGELDRIRAYIANNPENWHNDSFNKNI